MKREERKKYTDRHGHLYSSFATNKYRRMYI